MRLVKITSQSLGAKLTRDYMLARELAAMIMLFVLLKICDIYAAKDNQK